MPKMNEYISKAVETFRRSPDLQDEGVYRTLVAQGVEHRLAARLVEFVPMAYGRFLLAKSGARFSDYFRRKLPQGTSKERRLTSEPIWNAALSFAQTEAQHGVSVQDFLALAGRSAEFQAANRLLNQGSKLENLAFTSYLLPWPENGPPFDPSLKT